MHHGRTAPGTMHHGLTARSTTHHEHTAPGTMHRGHTACSTMHRGRTAPSTKHSGHRPPRADHDPPLSRQELSAGGQSLIAQCPAGGARPKPGAFSAPAGPLEFSPTALERGTKPSCSAAVAGLQRGGWLPSPRAAKRGRLLSLAPFLPIPKAPRCVSRGRQRP